MNLRTRLKQETSAAHTRVDDLIRELKPFSRQRGYRAYLLGMLQLHEYCRHSLEWVQSNSALERRDVDLEQLIRNDLLTVGGVDFPGVARQNSIDSKTAAEAWGEAYVMEGSAVGGSYMYREADRVLATSIGKTYLAQLSKDAGSRWKMFVQALNFDCDELDQERAVASAKHVFDQAFRIYSGLVEQIQS